MRNKTVQINLLNVRELLEGMVSANTIIAYEFGFRHYSNFAGTLEAAMKSTTLIEWRQHMIANTKYAPGTINLWLRGVVAVAKELYARQMISRDTYYDLKEVKTLPPNALLDRKRPQNRIKIEPEQMRQLCKVPPVSAENFIALRDRALMMLLATSGCRISEALNVKYHDIVELPDGNCMITNILGKHQSEPRNAPLSAEAFAAIKDWLAFRPISSPYIFTNVNYTDAGDMFYVSTPMNKSSATRRLKAYGESIGLQNIKAHDFRRFVGTQLARKDIRMAQKVLGHASLATTAKHYVLDEVQGGVTNDLF